MERVGKISKLKSFKSFNESMENDEGYTKEQLYDEGANLINRAADLLGNPDLQDEDPSEVIGELKSNGSPEALELSDMIENIQTMIGNFPSEEDMECDECDGGGCEFCQIEENISESQNIIKLKEVKVLETGGMSDEVWESCELKDLFDNNREDTIPYIIWGRFSEDEDERNGLDDYLINECGCEPGEKIVIERGSW